MNFADPGFSDDSSADPATLFDVVLRVSQTLRLRLNDWLSDFGLNEGRYSVLKSLANVGTAGWSQAELAEHLGQSESNVSTLIERMQRDRLVERLRSDADRRKRILLISDEGRSLLARVDGSRSTWAARLMHEIPSFDRATLITLLRQVGLKLDANVTRKSAVEASFGKPTPSELSTSVERHHDPIDDPQSPQFALQQMLLALSSQSRTETIEREVA